MSSHDKIDLDVYQFILETVTSSNTLDTMSNQVIQLLIGSMKVKGAAFFVLNVLEGELEIVATQGLSVDYVNKGPILVDKSIQLPSNRETVIISDTHVSDQLQYPEKAKHEGVRSIVSLPINVKGKTIGALRLYHSEVWKISPLEKSLLESLALNLGMALKYFRLVTTVEAMKETLAEVHPVWL
jgi:transcriptional regulator with GAF, ATPase, and Fis domain